MNYIGQAGSNHRRRWVLVLIAVFIASLAFFDSISLREKPKPQQPPDNYQLAAAAFLDALVKNDAQASFDLMSKRLKGQTDQVQWTNSLASSTFAKSKATYTFQKTEAIDDPDKVYGENAQPKNLYYSIQFSNSTSSKFLLTIIHEDNAFKIDRYSVTQ